VVNGIIRDANRCTEDKVGCGTYLLEAISTTPSRPGGTVNIVAPKGKSCPVSAVGCEEYTNLDEVAKGGEGKEYYSQVRQCVKPDHPGKTTYYTWVGDATRGFVLRAYDLLKSNQGAAPCTHTTFGTTSGAVPSCDDTTGANGTIAAAQVQCTGAGDLATNPDCAEYYDSALNVYYRLRSKTVTVSSECKPYRNTVDQTDTDNSNDGRVYFLDKSENRSCSATYAGCRAYTGNAGKTTRQLFNDTFENGTVANWVFVEPGVLSVFAGR